MNEWYNNQPTGLDPRFSGCFQCTCSFSSLPSAEHRRCRSLEEQRSKMASWLAIKQNNGCLICTWKWLHGKWPSVVVLICFDSYCSSYCSSPIPLWRTCCLWALQFCLTKGQRILIFIQDGSLLNLMWHAQNRSDQESLAVFAVDCFRATGLVLFLKMEGSFEPAGHDECGYQPGITFRQTSCRECLWKWGMEPQNCDYPLVP